MNTGKQDWDYFGQSAGVAHANADSGVQASCPDMDEFRRCQDANSAKCFLVVSSGARDLATCKFFERLTSILADKFLTDLGIRLEIIDNVSSDAIRNLIKTHEPLFLHVECHGVCMCNKPSCTNRKTNARGLTECHGDVESCQFGTFYLRWAPSPERGEACTLCEPGSWSSYLEGMSTKFVYFNACYSSAFAKSFSNSEEVPCIGINTIAAVKAAQTLAGHFYCSMASGKKLGDVLNDAKKKGVVRIIGSSKCGGSFCGIAPVQGNNRRCQDIWQRRPYRILMEADNEQVDK